MLSCDVERNAPTGIYSVAQDATGGQRKRFSSPMKQKRKKSEEEIVQPHMVRTPWGEQSPES
jgi:hypothetical protein